MKKRVIWLLNHETLSEFELPLIKDLGFEIYTPKKASKHLLQQSGSITYAYDEYLTIPKEELDILNNYNFYAVEEMPLVIKSIINKYFDAIFVMYDFYAIKKIVNSFEGLIFARAFGVGKDIKYYDLTEQVLGSDFFFTLSRIKDRFFFSHCYENIKDNEIGIYKEKAVYMPLGLPKDFYEIENQWNGKEGKILFFCTRINYIEESKIIYNQFKKDFKGFDYIIAGNQPVPVDDEKVVGFLEREKLNDLYRNLKLMFYHSTYPRHLHYHPLEAMIAGMPVLYLKGGALNVLGGKRQAGCCESIREARQKAKRIINGDMQLINMIREDQREILEKFSYNYNKKVWEQNFIPLMNEYYEKKSQLKTKGKTISLFFDQINNELELNKIIDISKFLAESLYVHNSHDKLAVNIHTKNKRYYDELTKINDKVSVKEFHFETKTVFDIKDIESLMFKQHQYYSENYLLPVDDAQNNVDSDLWLYWNYKIDAAIAPLKPYGVYVESLTDKFYGIIPNIHIANLKQAAVVMTSFETTKQDLIKHLGINSNKIVKVPYVFSLFNDFVLENIKISNEHILLDLDCNKLTSIDSYFNELSDYFKLYNEECSIVIHFSNFVENLHLQTIKQLQAYIDQDLRMKRKVEIYYNLRSYEYYALYAQASKVVFPHYMDHVLSKIEIAKYFNKIVYTSDFPIFNEFSKMINYELIQKKFSTDSKVLMEVLLEKNHVMSSNNSSTQYGDVLEESTSIWRSIL